MEVVKRLVVSATLFVALQSFADEPNAQEIFIRSIKYAGSGCPANSVSSSISGDGQAFTLIFSQYVAEASPVAAPPASRKICHVDLDLAVPSGWSFSISHVDYRGYAHLDEKVFGLHRSAYSFPGFSRRVATGLQFFRGPYDGDFTSRAEPNASSRRPVAPILEGNNVTGTQAVTRALMDFIRGRFSERIPGTGNGNPGSGEELGANPFDFPQWSRCGTGRDLRLSTEIAVDNSRNRAGSGLMSVDSMDGEMVQTYHLDWTRCR
jgi:hypothetical protein